MQFPHLGPALGDVKWAVVGAAATRMYMPERVTDDLDVLVRAQDGAVVHERLSAEGLMYLGPLSIGGEAWRYPSGMSIDVLHGHEQWTGSALDEAATNLDMHKMPILPLPYLALMKFQSSRAHDIGDVTRMLGLASDEQLVEVRAAFDKWLPGEMADLESLITLGRMELEG